VRDPLVPVTVRENVLAVVEEHDTVAVPEPATEVGVIAPQVSPAGTVSVRPTVPENPFTAEIVIVDVAEAAVLTAAGELAAIVKSTKLNVAVVECVIAGEVLVPVIDSVKVPAVVELQDTVAVPDPVTLLGAIAPQVNPVGTVSVKETTPAKPPTDVTVIVDEAELPALTAAGEVADIVKSCGAVNVNVAVAEWLSDPLVPVTVRVN